MVSTPQGRRSKLSDLFIPPTINPLAIKKMILGGKKCAIALLIKDITHTHIHLHIYVYIYIYIYICITFYLIN